MKLVTWEPDQLKFIKLVWESVEKTKLWLILVFTQSKGTGLYKEYEEKKTHHLQCG